MSLWGDRRPTFPARLIQFFDQPFSESLFHRGRAAVLTSTTPRTLGSSPCGRGRGSFIEGGKRGRLDPCVFAVSTRPRFGINCSAISGHRWRRSTLAARWSVSGVLGSGGSDRGPMAAIEPTCGRPGAGRSLDEPPVSRATPRHSSQRPAQRGQASTAATTLWPPRGVVAGAYDTPVPNEPHHATTCRPARGAAVSSPTPTAGAEPEPATRSRCHRAVSECCAR